MGYASLRACVRDLEANGQLRRITTRLDPNLQIPLIARRVYATGGPALLFDAVDGSEFPALCNLFGTMDRCRFIFRDTLDAVAAAIAARADLPATLKRPGAWLPTMRSGLNALPRQVGGGPVFARQCKVSDLPGIRCWPEDGGAFITLPQVLTEDPERPGPMGTNVGMYRVQLSGNEYADDEVGMHYQIHRGIGVHHAKHIERNMSMKVSVFVGGPPAHTVAAVMPHPEGLTELTIAGMLGGRRFRWARRDGHFISADADFCLVGTILEGETRPEGPFGDHLGYYSLRHEFPVMRVERVYHREDAIWPFTVVGRPPQEDTSFGDLIRELTGPMVPHVLPGLVAMHAVDAAGVHPLMLAIGRERYVPYDRSGPQELLTIANSILGFGHPSLAKYLMICAEHDQPELDIEDIPAYFRHVLERVDFARDLHFHTRTTIDTLDYSGDGMNRGSKLVMAACGPSLRKLSDRLPDPCPLPHRMQSAHFVAPGILALGGPEYADRYRARAEVQELCEHLERWPADHGVAWIVVVDDSASCARSFSDFLWQTFTRSNPAADIDGPGAATVDKHWGCRAPMVVDARRKPHHAPPLEEDPDVVASVEALAVRGGPLEGLI